MKILLLTLLYNAFASLWVMAQPVPIRESKFVSISGIEQWVTINGVDTANPVILFLHGGPGSVMSPYDQTVYAGWEKEFVLVHWDQRGAGRTFGRNAPTEVTEDYWMENPLTVTQMTADGIALATYLREVLSKEKVILVGSSWGSVLGVRMALQRPDLFYAYIGHAQMVNPMQQLTSAYKKVTTLARDAGDHKSLDQLVKLGTPPYDDARSSGALFRIIKKYERENSTPAPDTWWKLSPEYDNEIDAQHRYDGDDYSFLHFVGHKKLGIRAMMSDIDFLTDALQFRIPVYVIQGAHDILTPPESTKPWFEKLTATQKRFFLLSDAAHGYNRSVVDTQWSVLKDHVLPLTQQ